MVDFAPGGLRYATVSLLASLAAVVVSPVAAVVGLATTGFVLAFYRDPDRQVAPGGVASPADGRVSVIRRDPDGRLRVGVYMSAADVHVNRAPLSGTVEAVTHRPGANRPAFSKDSDRNEQVRVDCGAFDVVLVAGWFARRIHPYVEPGDAVERGDRIAHISFGSRADVVLPTGFDEADLTVEEGDRVVAGQTMLAAEPGVECRERA
ncbi:protein sorting system archaetidylserine decarboxylase [Halomarina salina]|uniref:Protein sorting system archaetidylserine decarboxylase n=1 Tax=Halomarina salina TaxID=1872699 RepID=A0ABD5RQW7_9EURY|nr:protein sorting system archaetidylserine decarboxylase [Halomarina salina]